ncbi:hypothetical protein AAFF_G00279620 [Aldrovandia affinis]|uniref:Neuromedin-S n=1 Tax=Aldrovandia affinis TaxID=143900 RepID=A0AAD7SSK0_9TELE|nr:hypothetical protein AAFF_G00279620 [Aldrovandia affinis]
MGITRPQLIIICLVLFFAAWPEITGFPYRFSDCVDRVPLRKDKIQDVYKRFLFHYSKSQNSHSVKSEVSRKLGDSSSSHSVHPLMRLSPKLSQRRKKQFFLMSSEERDVK